MKKKPLLLVVGLFILGMIIAIFVYSILKNQSHISEGVKHVNNANQENVVIVTPKQKHPDKDMGTTKETGVLKPEGKEIKHLNDEVFQEARTVLSDIKRMEDAKNRQIKSEETARKEVQELIQQPQVIHGTVDLPDLIEKGISFQMAVRTKSGVTPVIVSKESFASPKLAPDSYKLILFETTNTPGMRVENVVVTEGTPLEKIVFTQQNYAMTLVVKDEKGEPVSMADVTICKAASTGTDKNLVTFKTGQSDEKGCFTAKSLADGSYVISAKFENRETRRFIELKNDLANTVYMKIPDE